MIALDQLLKVRSAHSRSTNVELDKSQESLNRYIPTGRSLEVVSRVVESLKSSQGCRSFSIIGPYGSGKSSFVVFLGALLRGVTDEGSKLAWKALTQANAAVAGSLKKALGSTDRQFLLGCATAQREPINATVQRCIQVALKGNRKGFNFDAKLMAKLEKSTCTGKELVVVVQEILKRRPLLIAIDEFGKNLESFTDAPSASDLFVLQQLAELAQAETNNPLILITLQHLSFNEYVTGISFSGRKELSKIQGRFEEIPYNDSPEQYRRLVAEVFYEQKSNLVGKVDSWFSRRKSKFVKLDLDSLFKDVSTKKSFPLHPIALLCLPELCNRFGQNERTLFSFLTSNEPLSVRSFVKTASFSTNGELPFVRLDHIYDYFIRSASNTVGSAELASRLIEIETRVRDSQGLGSYREKVLKSVGVLNLVAAGGTTRSSGDTLAMAIHDCLLDDEDAKPLRAALVDLEEKGLITYREFADEYRIWSGTDFGLRQRLQEARREAKLMPLDQVLNSAVFMSPLVANRHSQSTGILRVFSRTFSSRTLSDALVPENKSVYDGAVIYWTSTEEPFFEFTGSLKKPLLVGMTTTKALEELSIGAIEAYAVEKVTNDAIAESADWVARKELAERSSYCRQKLLALIDSAWSSSESSWRLLNPIFEQLPKKQGLLKILSKVCDSIYDKSPSVKNETIARRILTGQGARARRILTEGILKNSSKPSFDIEGHGPEKSIYDAIFSATGLHSVSRKAQTSNFDFSFPLDSSWAGVAEKVSEFLLSAKLSRRNLLDLSESLQSPPIGLKEGLINLLLVVLVYTNEKTLLLYEHGSLVVELNDATVERLLRNPDHFAVKNLGLDNSKSGNAVEVIASAIGLANSGGALTLLDVSRKLYRDVLTLPAYALNIVTKLSVEAVEVRKAIKSATELDVLLYESLPLALHLNPLRSPGKAMPSAAVKEFADKLGSKIQELKDAYPNLLKEIRDRIGTELRPPLPKGRELRKTLESQAAFLKDLVLDKKLKAFVGGVLRDNLSEDEWTENLAMIIADGLPPRSWTEETLTHFGFSLTETCRAFGRLNALLLTSAQSDDNELAMFQVTVTQRGGRELSKTISAKKSEMAELEGYLESVFEKAHTALGSDFPVKEAMLAILSTDTEEHVEDIETDREEASGQ